MIPNRIAAIGLGMSMALLSVDAVAAPDFQEVYSVLRSNLVGVSEAELNRAAVRGMVDALGSKVTIVTNGTGKVVAESPIIGKTTLFDDAIGYIRIARVGEGLADAIRTAFREMNATNKLNGLVLDLRYAGGTDYNAAVAAVDIFLGKSVPLLNWGRGTMSSKEKTDAIRTSVAVLVNRETSAAAEAMAAMMRESGTAVILGSRTAGRAMVTQDFPLQSGDTLRIAVAPIALGDGVMLSRDGIRPDIDVTVRVEDERSYYADAFYVVPRGRGADGIGATTNIASGTNGSRRVRFNEAELVREHREGFDRVTGETPRERAIEPDRPVVNDPALARALDLLKGLAVVRQDRP